MNMDANMNVSQIRFVTAAAALVGVAVMCGCKSETKSPAASGASAERSSSATAAGAKKPGAIVVANKVCPIMVEHPVRKNLEMGLTREYKGKLVGFCCSDCPEAWDALSDEEKEQALADAAKAEAAEAAGGK